MCAVDSSLTAFFSRGAVKFDLAPDFDTAVSIFLCLVAIVTLGIAVTQDA